MVGGGLVGRGEGAWDCMGRGSLVGQERKLWWTGGESQGGESGEVGWDSIGDGTA